MKEKIKVAFQGEKGAYSHLACLEIFPNIEAKPCYTFEEAFKLGILTLMNTVNSSMYGLNNFDFLELNSYSKFIIILLWH